MHQRTATLEPSPRLLVAATAWVAIALALAVAGTLHRVPPLVPIAALTPILAAVIAYRRGGALRAFADRISLRHAVLLHSLRAPIGLYILLETRAGVVPELFGYRAGPGDIAIGVLALGAAFLVGRSRRAVTAWCALGILDLAIAFGTGQYLLFVVEDPRMALIGQLPWSLLPVLVVPVMIMTHLLVVARLRR